MPPPLTGPGGNRPCCPSPFGRYWAGSATALLFSILFFPRFFLFIIDAFGQMSFDCQNPTFSRRLRTGGKQLPLGVSNNLRVKTNGYKKRFVSESENKYKKTSFRYLLPTWYSFLIPSWNRWNCEALSRNLEFSSFLIGKTYPPPPSVLWTR